jgi:hypothetical protein
MSMLPLVVIVGLDLTIQSPFSPLLDSRLRGNDSLAV